MLMLTLVAQARENPFFPVDDASIPEYTTNHVHKAEPFRSASIKLPDSARILQSITLTYKNIDGSIATKKINVNKSVDWHRPIIVTQSLPQPHIKRTAAQTKHAKAPKFKKIASLKFISFYVSGKKIKVLTRDRLLRNFKLIKPDRIVLDFKREADFRTFVFRTKRIFKKITVGNHDGYYRVVIELDGRYIYKIKKLHNGYLITLE